MNDPDPDDVRSRERGGIRARFREMWHVWFPPRPNRSEPGVPHSSEIDIVPDDEEEP